MPTLSARVEPSAEAPRFGIKVAGWLLLAADARPCRAYIRPSPGQGDEKIDLDIIGELCQLLEFARIVMALSWKPVILAVPVQAWPAARMW